MIGSLVRGFRCGLPGLGHTSVYDSKRREYGLICSIRQVALQTEMPWSCEACVGTNVTHGVRSCIFLVIVVVFKFVLVRARNVVIVVTQLPANQTVMGGPHDIILWLMHAGYQLKALQCGTLGKHVPVFEGH